MKKTILLTQLLINTIVLFPQTCVVAKIFDNKIYIASDSRFGKLNYNENEKKFDTLFTVGCKIFHNNKIAYATIGVKTEEQRIFSDSLLRLNYTLLETSMRYAESFGKRLQDLIDFYYKNSPETYSRYFLNKPYISQTVFLGSENDTAKIFLIEFNINKKNINPPVISFSVGFTSAGNTICAGICDLVDSMDFKKETWEKGISTGLASLITAEAEKHPFEVGAPINILLIDKTRFIWLKKTTCDE